MTAPLEICDRRGFLLRAAALLGTGVTAACDNSPLSPLLAGEGPPSTPDGSGTLHLFANESGLFAGREPFVVGLLLTGDPETHSSALTALRESLGYFIELRYGSTDRFKEAYAEAALDHFFESEGLRFAAVATNASRSAGGIDATGLYEELLDALAEGGGSVALEMEHRYFDPAPDAALEDRLEGAPGVSVDFVPSHDSELLQLGDLLTGSVRGDMAREAKGRSNPRGRSPGGNVKDRIIASLKERLGVQRLSHPSLANEDGFNVQVLHPPF